MIEQKTRPFFQKYFVDNVANILVNKISPNSITLLSLFLGLLSAMTLFIDVSVSVVLLLLSGYLDILDGSVARAKGETSDFGTVLDIISDRFVECFIIIAIFIHQPDIAIAGLFMMMSIIVCISSFLLVGIFSQKQSHKSFYYSAGFMERAETFVFFVIMMIFPDTVLLLSVVFTILVLWTTFYRVYEFCKHQY